MLTTPKAQRLDSSGAAFPQNPLKGETRWWIMHPLFRDYALERSRSDGTDLNEWHRRAIEWFAENDLLPEGIVHAAANGLTTDSLRMTVVCVYIIILCL